MTHAETILRTLDRRGHNPQDMEDAALVIHSAGISRAEVADAIARAKVAGDSGNRNRLSRRHSCGAGNH
jgi:hypothetical protein